MDTLTIFMVGKGVEAPDIDVSPTSFTHTLNEGDSVSTTFTVSNTGPGNLYYQVMPKGIQVATEAFKARALRSSGFNVADNPSVDGKNSANTHSVFTTQTTVSGGHGNLLILAARTEADAVNEVVGYLNASNRFGTITVFNANAGTPTLDELKAFDGVMTYSWNSYGDPAAIGNVLADYIDDGGNVMVAFAANASSNPFGIEGRFDSENYWLLKKGSFAGSPVTLGSVLDASHPVMADISTIDAAGSYTGTEMDSNATVLAKLSNNVPLAAVRVGKGKRIDISIVPESKTYTTWGIDLSSDADEFIVNAASWLIGGSGWAEVDVNEDTLASGQSKVVNLKIRTKGLIGGSYDGKIAIVSNDPDEASVDFTANLTVIGVPDIDVPDSLMLVVLTLTKPYRQNL